MVTVEPSPLISRLRKDSVKSFLIVLALLVSTIPASAQGQAPYVAMTLGSSIDLATSLSAISSGLGKEGNPVLAHGGTTALVGGKVATTAGLAVIMRKLAKEGHPRIAAIVGYSAGFALASLGARNARVGR